MMTCWCGSARRGPSAHPAYVACADCGTLASARLPDDELRRLYSFDGYWHEYMTRALGFPAIEDRARGDFGDRIPSWWQAVAAARPAARSVLEIGCAHGGFLHH